MKYIDLKPGDVILETTRAEIYCDYAWMVLETRSLDGEIRWLNLHTGMEARTVSTDSDIDDRWDVVTAGR